MKKIIIYAFLILSASCSNKKDKMEIIKVPNLEIITGSKSKIDYFEVNNCESYSPEESMKKIKDYYERSIIKDSLKKYNEYQCYFYKHTFSIDYSSFVGKNTSNFEEGGIRDWDNPFLYNMNEYLLAAIYRNNENTNYIIYQNNNIILDIKEKN